MLIGPYIIKNDHITYVGNRRFSTLSEVRGVRPPSFKKRYRSIYKNAKHWEALIRLWAAVFKATNKFMDENDAVFFDLPMTTRMISSPGALTGTIPCDVDPFKISFFGHPTYLSQSSQLYLELAITHPEIKRVYSWCKSFRQEQSDFRHLPEFTHLEFEAAWNFNANLQFQEKYIRSLLYHLFSNNRSDLSFFLDKADLLSLETLMGIGASKCVTFEKAFELLKESTGLPKYSIPTVHNFNAYEEILLTQLLDGPVFVTHFNQDEVAFYHAPSTENGNLALNADFLWPGYGELIGSGERIHTKEEVESKARHFCLNFKDYESYIKSHDQNQPLLHSGWGMGIERFLQAILKLPFIWDTKLFPRVDNQIHP